MPLRIFSVQLSRLWHKCFLHASSWELMKRVVCSYRRWIVHWRNNLWRLACLQAWDNHWSLKVLFGEITVIFLQPLIQFPSEESMLREWWLYESIDMMLVTWNLKQRVIHQRSDFPNVSLVDTREFCNKAWLDVREKPEGPFLARYLCLN